MLPRSSISRSLRFKLKSKGYLRCYATAGTEQSSHHDKVYHPRVSYAISQEQLGQIRDHEHILRAAALKALGLTTWLGESSEAKKVEQIAYKKFFVPYWLVRIGLYAPVIHADPKRDYSDGRISADISFSLAGTSHQALSTLYFPNATYTLPSTVVKTSYLASSHVGVPFSVQPPLACRNWFESLFEPEDILLSSNIQIRPKAVQCRVGAIPILRPITLGEFRYNDEYLTVAYCSYTSNLTEDTRIYRNGSWNKSEKFGPVDADYSVSWDRNDPKGVDQSFYTALGKVFHQKAEDWLRQAMGSGPLGKLNEEIWQKAEIGEEGFKAVRTWREGKLDLWLEGYELRRE